MAKAVTSKGSRRPNPQRYRVSSGRGTHQAGNTFVNAMITAASVNTTVLSLTFDQVISLDGVPGIVTDIAETPVSAVLTSPTTVDVTFSGDLTGAAVTIVPLNDPAIRTRSGGWVCCGTHPFPS